MLHVAWLRRLDCSCYAGNFERAVVPLHSWRHVRSSATQEVSWQSWPQRPGFNPSPFHVRFLVYKGQVFLEYFGLSLSLSFRWWSMFIHLSITDVSRSQNRQCSYVTNLGNAVIRGSGGGSPLILNLCSIWRDWAVMRPGRFTPWEVAM
jgi:hypothetical protein